MFSTSTMKIKISYLIIFIFLLSCNEQQRKIEDKRKLPEIKNVSSITEKKNSVDSLPQLFPGTDTLIFPLKMNNADEHLIVPLKISFGDSIYAFLTSEDKKANIRINQIQLPDSTLDGPFGTSLHYKIKGVGQYKIIIAEDMMAGDRWKGNFSLKVWVK